MKTGSSRWALRMTVAVAAAMAASPVQAQTVMVQVLGADTSEPLIGAIAHLVLPTGRVVASRLTDRNGRALFPSLEAGQYVARAEMIGHATGESDVFGVVEGASVPLILRLQSRAIELEGVEVTAAAGPCRTRPGREGRLLADVWGEVAKALGAASMADEQGLYRYAILMYERELDEDRALVSEERSRRTGYMRTPFESRPVEDLTINGFVRRDVSEWTYHAPDAQVLISDGFLDTHCFRLVDGGREAPGLVGLAFEPTGEKDDITDISGTLWLDRESVELRWLEFTYENLGQDVRSGDATGRVEFQRTPEGTWIVPEWWIRMPLVEIQVGGIERRRRITGFRQTGGRVLEIIEAGGRDLGRGVSTGAVEGLVVDSMGLPMPGVRVGYVGSNQQVFTDTEGRFNLVGLAEGTYRIRFVDAQVESLGLTPPPVTREVAPGVSSYLEFHMPSPGDMLADMCRVEAEPGKSVLAGIVREQATERTVSGAVVRLRWSRFEATGATAGLVGREAYTIQETTSDANGFYRFCAVPRQEELTLWSVLGGVESAPQTLALSGREESHLHVIRRRVP
ncbi:MAG: carboxypeptidase-like regulatory domain-containing protein [Gemmatimonadota bacterium]|nr:carboxypeptidase-like regulatory domain-containing protein [Gemmatimonadota bacterium]MDH3421804.1 carboxypeptidase-like regulatory domain-containing protein [Gemmatimonadota bacterium]